nr:MAG TPA: hypothetical protein [Caudoviricetes sp.]
MLYILKMFILCTSVCLWTKVSYLLIKLIRYFSIASSYINYSNVSI